MLKIWATESFYRVSLLFIEAAGSAGAMPMAEIDGATFDLLAPFYSSRPMTIYGGSNEIQRNILAKEVLGLPR